MFTVGEAARSGRLDDGEAHYGGAGVRAGSGGINTNSRNIPSKRNPVVGDSVCLTGMITRVTGLMQARRANDVTVRGGDSGGPVHIRSGTANAVALGMIIAYTDSGRNAFATKSISKSFSSKMPGV